MTAAKNGCAADGLHQRLIAIFAPSVSLYCSDLIVMSILLSQVHFRALRDIFGAPPGCPDVLRRIGNVERLAFLQKVTTVPPSVSPHVNEVFASFRRAL